MLARKMSHKKCRIKKCHVGIVNKYNQILLGFFDRDERNEKKCN